MEMSSCIRNSISQYFVRKIEIVSKTFIEDLNCQVIVFSVVPRPGPLVLVELVRNAVS